MPSPKLPKIRVSEAANVPTHFGAWCAVAFTQAGKPHEQHLLMTYGNVAGERDVLVRLQSECVTGEVFGSRKCDCGEQLAQAMRAIRKKGSGVIVYLRQEGRGVGLFNKIRAYHLQDHGYDTVEANRKLGLPDDAREYGGAAAALKALGLKSAKVLTNDPHKVHALQKFGVKVSGRVPLRVKPNKYDREYLATKRAKLGHVL